MSSSRPAATTARAAGTRSLAWTVLAAAVIEIVAPGITFATTGGSPGAGGADLLITPAGWAFAIWGVIYTLAIAQAVVVLRGGDAALGGIPRRLQVDQVVLYLGGALWIAMSTTGSSIATALALLVMLVAAVDGVLVTARGVTGSRALVLLTRANVGLYAGWVTAAFFLNLASALVELDAFGAGRVDWQLVVLTLAALSLLLLALTTRVVAYVVAGVWALFGISVNASSIDEPAVLGLAVAAAVVLTVVAAGGVVRERRTAVSAA